MEENTILKEIKRKSDLDIDDIEGFFDAFKCEIENEKDKLAVMAHLIMIRENFLFLKDEMQNFYLNQVKNKNYFNKLSYNCFRSQRPSIEYIFDSNILVCVLKSGKYVDIELKYKNFNSKFLKIDLNDFFYNYLKSSNEKKMKLFKDFELKFKSSILVPFKFYLKSTNEIFQHIVNGLSDLPVELLIFKLSLKYLDIRSISSLMQTSKHFYQMFNSDLKSSKSIWCYLIRRDFRNDYAPRESDSINFKDEFITFFKGSFKFKKRLVGQAIVFI